MKLWTIFVKTLGDIRGSTVGIGALIAGMAIIALLIYPSYSEGLENFEVPEAMAGFLGEASGITSPEGFITAEFFSWIPLVLTLLAIVGGTAAFAGEEGAGTMDLLLSQPIKRWQLAVAKAVALICAITIAALVAIPGFAVGKAFVDIDISLGRLSASVVYMLPLSLFFLGLSLWASAMMPSRGSAAMLLAGLVIVTYMLQVFADAAPVLESVRKISPFYWSEPSRVLINGFDWTRALAFLLLALVGILLSVWSFEHRDIQSGAREWSVRDLFSSLRFRQVGMPDTLDRSLSKPTT